MGIDKVGIDEMGINLRITAACLEYSYFHSVPQHKLPIPIPTRNIPEASKIRTFTRCTQRLVLCTNWMYNVQLLNQAADDLV